jgi:hypothetical protein
VDLIQNGEQAYLSAQGNVPRSGDRIWLDVAGRTMQFRVIEADSYDDAAETWMALLLRES